MQTKYLVGQSVVLALKASGLTWNLKTICLKTEEELKVTAQFQSCWLFMKSPQKQIQKQAANSTISAVFREVWSTQNVLLGSCKFQRCRVWLRLEGTSGLAASGHHPPPHSPTRAMFRWVLNGNPHGWRLHSLSGEAVPMSSWAVRCFYTHVEFSVFQFVSIACCPLLDTTEKDLALPPLHSPTTSFHTWSHAWVYILSPTKTQNPSLLLLQQTPIKGATSEALLSTLSEGALAGTDVFYHPASGRLSQWEFYLLHHGRCRAHAGIPLWIGLGGHGQLPIQTLCDRNAEVFSLGMMRNVPWQPVWLHSAKMSLTELTGN